MFRLVVLSAVLAVAAAAPGVVLSAPLASPLIAPSLPATLLPRVAIAPAATTIVKQPIVVQEPQPVLRDVPVPLKAISYAAPAVIPAPYAVPTVYSTGHIASPLIAPTWGAPLSSAVLLK